MVFLSKRIVLISKRKWGENEMKMKGFISEDSPPTLLTYFFAFWSNFHFDLYEMKFFFDLDLWVGFFIRVMKSNGQKLSQLLYKVFQRLCHTILIIWIHNMCLIKHFIYIYEPKTLDILVWNELNCIVKELETILFY